jgi:hypothetical protein
MTYPSYISLEMSCSVLLCFLLGLLELILSTGSFSYRQRRYRCVGIGERYSAVISSCIFIAGKGIVRLVSLQIAMQVILFLPLITWYGFDSLPRGFIDEEYFFIN